MTIAEEFTYRDISGLMSYWRNWNEYHSRTSVTSMAFTRTGAVPLEIDVSLSGPRAGFSEGLDLSPHCVRCMSDLAQFCRDVRSEGRPFTIVLGPVLPEVLEQNPLVRAVITDRKQQFLTIAKGCNAGLFDITDYAAVDESCFANSLHLNSQGMTAVTAQLARFRRGDSIAPGTLTCGGLHLATTSSAGQQRSSIARAGSN
jgi:hypothetical protein